MVSAVDAAYDAWKEADAAAREVERQVDLVWLRHDRGEGEPPSKDLLRNSAYLRHIAREKLTAAIALIPGLSPGN